MLKNLLNLLPAPIVRKIGDSSFANLEERGAISTWMVATPKNETDADDWGDFDIDDFDFDPSAEISDTASTDAYIDRQISKIPQFGDGARWRLADYLNMFDDLSRDGTLTPEQRDAVDNFVAGYQLDRFKLDECCGCEVDSSESQGDVLTWEDILADNHDYVNCDYDEAELTDRMAMDEEARRFDGFTS